MDPSPASSTSRLKLFFSAAALVLLAACVANPPREETAPSGPLGFVDIPGFDIQLEKMLRAAPASVRIEFYDKINPSHLPPRILPLMAAVQSSGGEVKVVLPAGEPVPRGFPLLSIVPLLWDFLKSQSERSQRAELVAGYDAEIRLRRQADGDRVVDAIVLVKRSGVAR